MLQKVVASVWRRASQQMAEGPGPDVLVLTTERRQNETRTGNQANRPGVQVDSSL